MIAIGIKNDSGTTWYKAHSLTRRRDGSFCVFDLDDNRTNYIIKARQFRGVTVVGDNPYCSYLSISEANL